MLLKSTKVMLGEEDITPIEERLTRKIGKRVVIIPALLDVIGAVPPYKI